MGIILTKSRPTNKTLKNRIIVQKASDFGASINSSAEYFIDGIIDMTGVSIEVPETGINIKGYDYNSSQLVCDDDSYTMFTSPVGGSGDVLFQNVSFTTSGTSSQLLDLTDSTGIYAFEISKVNFNNCTSIGELNGYRQGLETDTGRFGGTPSLTLSGEWDGGYRITTSIVRALSPAMTSALFVAGTGFTMGSRFLTDINVDLPANAPLMDFSPSNFLHPSLLLIQNAIISRDGAFDPTDSNILPNITHTDLEAAFSGNRGIANTFVGGKLTVDSEVTTTINTQSTFETLEGGFGSSNLAHFDNPSAGQLRHLGDNPREYRIVVNFVIEGFANAEIAMKIRIWDDSLGTFVDGPQQTKLVNSLIGGRDVAFFNIIDDITLDQNDYVYLEIANNSSTFNVTAEEGSYFIVGER